MDPAAVGELLSKCALYGFFSRCLRPSKGVGVEAIKMLSPEVPQEWREKIQDLYALWVTTPEDSYSLLFGSGGLCHDCETAYRMALPIGTLLADVVGFYRAFGFPVHSVGPNPPDHISTELEFLSFMFAKEAHAIFCGRPEAVETCRQARSQFIREHLSQWTHLFAESVAGHAPGGFYSSVASLIDEAIKEEP